MPYSWIEFDGSGETGRSGPFADRGEAEAWMGEAWEQLLDRGVLAVELVDDGSGEALYRMSLEPEENGSGGA
jgi:hypothetical protein